MLLFSNSPLKGLILSFSSLAVHLLSLQVCIMEMALEKSSFPACLWELDQKGSLGLIIRQRGDPTCSSSPQNSHPLNRAIMCPLFNLGKSLGQETHRKHTGNVSEPRHEQELTQGGGENKTQQSKLFHQRHITAKASLAGRRHWCISLFSPG